MLPTFPVSVGSPPPLTRVPHGAQVGWQPGTF